MLYIDSPPTNKETQESYYVIHDESRIQQLKRQNYYDMTKNGILVGNNNDFLLIGMTNQTHDDIPSSTVSNGATEADKSVLSISGSSHSHRDVTDTVNVKKLQPENISLIHEITKINKKIEKLSSVEEIKLAMAQRDNIIEQYFEDIILSDPEQAEFYRIAERQAKRNSDALEELNRSSTSQTGQNPLNPDEESRATRGYQDNAQRESATITEHQNNDQTVFIELQKHHDAQNSPMKWRAKRSIANVDQTITQDSDGHLDQNLEENTISVVNSQGDRVVTGVAEDTRSNDAVDIAQLNSVKKTSTSAHSLAQTNTSRINNLEHQLSKINTKIDQRMAASAALTGLFQPYGVGNINVTASIGGYGAFQAIAVGTGYRINENIAVKTGVAYSDGNNVMYNVSFNLEW